MNSVVVGGPGLVAVGWDGSHGYLDAEVWTSSDGLTWQRVPEQEALGGFDNQDMWSVVAGGPGLVAVGGSWLSAAVWTSQDGLTWRQVPTKRPSRSPAGMRGVVAGGPGFVAVGGTVLWVSADGLVWQRVPNDQEVFRGAWVNSMIAGGPGLVAVGCALDSSDNCATTLVWTSSDGLSWEPVPGNEAAFDGCTMYSVVAVGPRLIGVGTDASGEDQNATVLVSPPATWADDPTGGR